jgi:hypothetical protein
MTATAVQAKSHRVDIVAAVTTSTSRGECHRVRDRSVVASQAVQSLVSAVKREACLLVMIETPDEPVIRVVAHSAVGPEVPLVDVILAMAVNALVLRVLEAGVRMAALAGDGCVQAEQREGRQIVVEPYRLGPTDLAMTVLASFTEAPLVHVITPMTASALRFWSRRFDRAAVARGANQLAMCAVESEAAVASVIEAHAGPVRWRVARLTLGAVIARMYVVGTMTGDAVWLRRMLEGRVGMAGCTG